MKQGKTLSQLATEIERQARAKVDFVASCDQLHMAVPHPAGSPVIQIKGQPRDFGITAHAHRQLGDKCGIPAKYYDRCQSEDPELLALNVNAWMRKHHEPRLIRTLDGDMRAFLSNSYQRIDNLHVAEVVLPVLASTPSIEVVSCEITESRLYIKAVDHSVKAKVKGTRRVGDVVEAGVIIGNSEIGQGAIVVNPFFNFLACLNGMVRAKAGMRAQHLGTKLDADENLARILADDTRKASDRALLMKVRDVVRLAMDAAAFQRAIEAMEASTEDMMRGDVNEGVKILANDFGMTEGESSSVLRHLIQGGDLSRFGVMNAVTRTAADLESYDRATDFETMGGRVLDMSRAEWKRVAEAA